MLNTLFRFLFIGQSALALSAGDLAPDFKAKNQDGKVVRLSDFKGKFVLVYFYPKDDTPGCTVEANQLTEQFPQFAKSKAVVLGVSRQDEESHQRFKKKYKIPYDLLVDSDGSLAKSFGVGLVPVIGLTQRQSILIGPDGRVVRFYDKVEPASHAQSVLEDIQKNISKK